jgi:hypothetical protein
MVILFVSVKQSSLGSVDARPQIGENESVLLSKAENNYLGVVAHLVERCIRIAEVRSSILLNSTI